MEELEQRVVLTGFIDFTAPATGSNLTLQVAEVGGATDLQLFDNIQSTVIQQVPLTQDIQVNLTGSATASDRLTVNFAYSGSGTPEPISVSFDGGLPAMNSTDLVTIDGTGPLYEAASFSLTSNANILVSGALETSGDITLLASQENDGALTAPGTIAADASSSITVSGGTLTGDSVSLTAQSTINVNSQRRQPVQWADPGGHRRFKLGANPAIRKR